MARTDGSAWGSSNKYFNDPMAEPAWSWDGEWGSLPAFSAWNYSDVGPNMDLTSWTNMFGVPPMGTNTDTTGTEPPPGSEEEAKKRRGRTKPHWEETYHVANAPSWWKGFTANKLSRGAEQASIINALIPFMSAKDQVAAASMLSTMSDAFKAYKNVGAIPNEKPNDAERQWMGSKERMQGMLDSLSQMRKSSGTNFGTGPGLAFMQNVVKNMNANAASGSNTQTRQQLLNMGNALSAFSSQAQSGSLSPYAALLKMIAQPSYTEGYLNPTTQVGADQYISGTPMPGYF